MKRPFALLALSLSLFLPACSGLTSGLGLPKLPPAPVLSVVPTSLTLSVSGAAGMHVSGTITASDTGTSAFYSATSSDVTILTVAPANGATNAFVVTAVKAGSAKAAVTDGNGNTINVPVTVNP